MSVLVFEDVRKVFRSSLRGRHLYELGPVSLSVEAGEIFGYLGPNGAGKTTTIKIAMGLLKPTAGRVAAFGVPSDSMEAKARIGFLPEQPYFYRHLTAGELLRFYGEMFGIKGHDLAARAKTLLEKVGLAECGDTRLSRFSKGMLQRIGLAQALINDPELVILDEPLSALDPVGRREVRDLILDLKAGGKTVFFSSHILQDVEMICDRVAILRAGKVLRVASLVKGLTSDVTSFEILVDGLSIAAATSLGFADVSVRANRTVVTLPSEEGLSESISRLISAGCKIWAVLPVRLTLEDYFMRQIVGDRQPADRTEAPVKGIRGI